ncbi:bifunctional DNA primase/polymerase [Mycobacterium paraffinicum]|uniref:DNA primase/polymerase bifunctional N-terminal domain-containing protein n=1 Tax=Mycobacterium paraffinicum TaxID=53378 RepID=A0ABP8F230_9MYCO|nr:bifunctional DNA primase/polymerase [Mycobacterium paraffinicum]
MPSPSDNGAGTRDELLALANILVANYMPGQPVTAPLLLAFALTYAQNGWRVFPLTGKEPAIKSPHPKGYTLPDGKRCHGECGLDGHGVWDATTEVATICRWWAVECPGANIGANAPGLFALDNDPKTTGHPAALAALTAQHGPLPGTLTHLSGRLDGGAHRFYRRPQGKLSTAKLGPGFDIKQFPGGYTVMPPSLHPATQYPYIAVDAEIADAGWLSELIAVQPQARRQSSVSATFLARGGHFFGAGESIADAYTDNTSWADVLEPHGWECLDNDPDAEGARWLHPAATSKCSATISNGLLFVYSTRTVFEPTAAGEPHGYTRFRAYAELNHRGDLSRAAAELRRV